MKKMGAGLLFFGILLILFEKSSIASVASSKHNLTSRGSSRNVCSYCHVPHNAAGNKIWSKFGNVSQITSGPSSAIGNLCFTCHDGTVTDVGLKTVFNTALQQHKTSKDSDCNMCHTVHDNTNGKFLGIVKTGGGATGTGTATYCETCHSGPSMPARAADLGDHVTGAQHPYKADSCNLCHRVHGAANYTPKDGKVTNPILKVSNEDSALCGMCHLEDAVQKTKGGVRHPANLVTAGAWGKLTCETCHDPHQPGVTNRTAILREDNTDSRFCMTCHQSTDSASGPGIGEHSHPIKVPFNKVRPTDPKVAPAANEIDEDNQGGPDYPGNSNSIVCESCHSMHYKGTAAPLLRVTSDGGQLCVNCHSDK